MIVVIVGCSRVSSNSGSLCVAAETSNVSIDISVVVVVISSI